ncbi:MAG: protein kinase family protein [Chlamydiales bacterium]|nr:protein kinase family protein [Chlamydiales bacterium]
MSQINPYFVPLKLEVRDNTDAAPSSHLFGGGRKMVRLVVLEKDKMFNMVAARLSSEKFEDAKKELAKEKSLSIFRCWVPVIIKKGDKEEHILVNIRSVAKRLGVSRKAVFEAAKSGTFQDLISESKACITAFSKLSSEMRAFINSNRDAFCKAGPSYQPDPSGLCDGLLFSKSGAVWMHFKGESRDFAVNFGSQEQVVFDAPKAKNLSEYSKELDENIIHAQSAFKAFQTALYRFENGISDKEIREISNYIIFYRKEKQKKAVNSSEGVSYVRKNEPPHNLARDVQFNADGTVFIHFNKKIFDERSKVTTPKNIHLAINFDTKELFTVTRLDRMQEIDFLKRFENKSGIAQITQCVTVKGEIAETFFIQPLYERDLYSAVRSGELSPKQKAQIALELLRGAKALAEEGVIHRDIKPKNILLDKNNHAYIAHFESAVENLDLENKGKSAGDSEYYSPEYRNAIEKNSNLKDATTSKHDIWALGRVIHFIVSGSDEWFGIEREPTEPLEKEPLKWLVRDLLRKDPKERLSAAKALAMYEPHLKRIFGCV